MGIIVLLAGILVVATAHMYRSALVTRTQSTITILALGLDDFKKTYGSYPYHGPAADPSPAPPTPPPVLSKRLSGLLPNTETNYDIRNIYYLLVVRDCIKKNAIDPKYLAENTNSVSMSPDNTVLDAWGAPLCYRYPRAQRGTEASSVYESFDLWSKADSGGAADPTDGSVAANGDNIICWPFNEKR